MFGHIVLYAIRHQLLKLIAELKELVDNYRVIMVDDGSSDGTYELASRASIRLEKI